MQIDAWILRVIEQISLVLKAPLMAGNRIWLPLLFSGYLLGFYLFFKREPHGRSIVQRVKSALSACFPKQIMAHRSALLDYKYFIINGVLFSAFLAPFITTIGSTAGVFHELLLTTFGPAPIQLESTSSTWILGLVTIAFIEDFGLYVSHWLHHRIPLLWFVHKVHHSAEVLTPISLYRVHPIELLIHGSCGGIFGGIAFATIQYFSAQDIPLSTIFGMNILVFLVAVFGSNLRHSHIFLRFPAWLSRILMSPAQHQVHHSVLKAHHDKNLGSSLSIWDWIFGTLYLPAHDEKISFGVTESDSSARYSSLTDLYLSPIKEQREYLRKRLTNSRHQGNRSRHLTS